METNEVLTNLSNKIPDDINEEGFRRRYAADIIEGETNCQNYWTTRCVNRCRFLIVDGGRHRDERGLHPIFGLNCEAIALSWDGADAINSTVQAFCRGCGNLLP